MIGVNWHGPLEPPHDQLHAGDYWNGRRWTGTGWQPPLPPRKTLDALQDAHAAGAAGEPYRDWSRRWHGHEAT